GPVPQADWPRVMASIPPRLEGRALDAALEAELNRTLPAGGPVVREVFDACRDGIADGWMCSREHAGIRYGRVVKPGPATHGYSVDVVEMKDVAGGHHRHPNGETDLVMPSDQAAACDGPGAGWRGSGPGSAHVPTVTGGKAWVLYLLPQGAIEFTKA